MCKFETIFRGFLAYMQKSKQLFVVTSARPSRLAWSPRPPSLFEAKSQLASPSPKLRSHYCANNKPLQPKKFK